MPAGSSFRISSTELVQGKTALKTCCSRTRRAISCVYCPPKSSTTIPPRSVFNISCGLLCAIFAVPSISSPHVSADFSPKTRRGTINRAPLGSLFSANSASLRSVLPHPTTTFNILSAKNHLPHRLPRQMPRPPRIRRRQLQHLILQASCRHCLSPPHLPIHLHGNLHLIILRQFFF